MSLRSLQRCRWASLLIRHSSHGRRRTPADRHPALLGCWTPPPARPPALTPLYEHLCGELGLPKDESKVASMRAVNEAKLAELAAKVTDAEENLGETEVRRRLPTCGGDGGVCY